MHGVQSGLLNDLQPFEVPGIIAVGLHDQPHPAIIEPNLDPIHTGMDPLGPTPQVKLNWRPQLLEDLEICLLGRTLLLCAVLGNRLGIDAPRLELLDKIIILDLALAMQPASKFD